MVPQVAPHGPGVALQRPGEEAEREGGGGPGQAHGLQPPPRQSRPAELHLPQSPQGEVALGQRGNRVLKAVKLEQPDGNVDCPALHRAVQAERGAVKGGGAEGYPQEHAGGGLKIGINSFALNVEKKILPNIHFKGHINQAHNDAFVLSLVKELSSKKT